MHESEHEQDGYGEKEHFISPQDMLTPEQSKKLADFEINSEEVTPDDVFTLAGEKDGLPQEITEDQRTYLSKLMGTPGEWIAQDSALYQLMDGLLSATFAHYLSLPKFIGGEIEGLIEDVFHKKIKLIEGNAVDRFLQEQLQNYDPNFHQKISKDLKERPLIGIAVKMIYKKVKVGDLLGAYESFWGSWNPLWRQPNKMLYKGAGGKNRPFFASVTTMGYSGFIHVFHPLALPLYIAVGATSNQPLETFLLSMGVHQAGRFAVLGIPVGLKKYLKNRHENAEANGDVLKPQDKKKFSLKGLVKGFLGGRGRV